FFEADCHLDRVLDHVVVGEDGPVGIDHDPRPGGLSLALGFSTAAAAEQVEGRFAFLDDGRGDEGDAGRVTDVDLVGRQHAALVRCVGGRGGRGLDGGDGGGAAAESTGGGDDRHDDAAAEESGDEGNEETAFHSQAG